MIGYIVSCDTCIYSQKLDDCKQRSQNGVLRHAVTGQLKKVGFQLALTRSICFNIHGVYLYPK